MKKRLLSAFLALALSIGLAVPVFAAGDSVAEQTKTLSLTYSIDGHSFESFSGIDVSRSWKLNYRDFDNPEKILSEDYNGYLAVRQDTVLTAKNTAPAGENSFIRVYLNVYEKNSDGTYWDNRYPHELYLTQSGDFLDDFMSPSDFGGLLELRPGESVQFKLPGSDSSDRIYQVKLMKWDMDHAETVTNEWGFTYEQAPTYYKWSMLKVDNAAVDSYLAGQNPSKPVDPVEPPVTQPTSADAYPYSIPYTPDFLRFSAHPVGSYQTEAFDLDIGGDKTVTVYTFPAGTKLGLTAEGIEKGYTIANVSSNDFDNWGKSEITLTNATRYEQWFMVSSADDPEGFIAYVHPINTSTSFNDVKAGAYYDSAVQWAVKYGVTNGTSTTTFTPDRTCSNAEILTMVYRAFEWMHVYTDNPFTDVKESDYYYDAARWAAEYNIISGTTLDPNKPCTRAMAVTYIWKALNAPETAVSTAFSDVPNSADYAQAVSWAVGAGVTNGTSTTTFSPNDTCTRGQIVTFLYRALK